MFFPPLRLAVLTVYVVAISAAPSLSTAPSLTDAANLGDPGPSTVLAPGDSINVIHDSPAADRFTQSGTGDYPIEPPNPFTYVDADDTPKDLYATAEGIAKVKLPGSLAVPRSIHDKRVLLGPKIQECAKSDKVDIRAAIREAEEDLASAYSSVRNLKLGDAGLDTDLFERWFGTYTDGGRSTVKGILSSMKRTVRFSSYTIRCEPMPDVGYPAEIYPKKKLILLNQNFLRSDGPAQRRVILRMAGNLNSFVINVAVGPIGARNLVLSESRDAFLNLANYEAFIQKTPNPYTPLGDYYE